MLYAAVECTPTSESTVIAFYVTVSSSGSLFYPIAYDGQSAAVAELFVLVEENYLKKQTTTQINPNAFL